MAFSADLPKLADVFRDKPEVVTCFPEWMLSPKQVEDIRCLENAAIVEIAGRDSVAAAIKSVAEHGFTDLIPVYAYTGTEYGEWETVVRAAAHLAARLPEIRVHPLVAMGSPMLWRALNARFIEAWIRQFHYYSPCPGCHLYLHAVRIPLSRILGDLPIISGERESHSGIEKINQTGPALDIYLALAQELSARLLLPLRHVADGRKIEEILGFAWKRGEGQLGCVFSGNYRLADGSVGPKAEEVRRYFMEFAVPTARAVIDAYVNGNSPDAEAVARGVLEDRTCF